MRQQDAIQKIESRCAESARNVVKLAELAPTIWRASAAMTASFAKGGKIMFCGNGGSAADSQHLATELMGRFLRDRAPLAALALTTDSSALTAIGNDYGGEHIFSRQLAGIGKRGDILVAISASGASANVLRAAMMAKSMGVVVIALTGEKASPLAAASDIALPAPAQRVDLIQELHIAIGHMLCDIVEEERFGNGGA